MEKGVQLGLEEGLINIVGPMSQLRGTIDTASCMLECTNAHMCFPSRLYSRQLRVSCTLIYRGEVTHRAHHIIIVVNYKISLQIRVDIFKI